MKKGILILLAAMTLVMSLTVSALPNWDLTGAWTFNDIYLGTYYVHSMTISVFQDETGTFSGTGFYTGDPALTWEITGTEDGNTVDFVLTVLTVAPGVTLTGTGTIASDGLSMGGTGYQTNLPGTDPNVEWTATGTATALDDDGDTVLNGDDNCPQMYNPTQANYDEDGIGDACDRWACPELTVPVILETLNVPVDTLTDTVSSTVLDSAKMYLVTASGVADAGDDIDFDAEYSYHDGYSTEWTDYVANYESYGVDLLDLFINGNAVDWGAYDAGHKYPYLVHDLSGPVSLGFHVNYVYSINNIGSLGVDIAECIPDSDGDGYAAGVEDCDDTDPEVIPGSVRLTADQDGLCAENTETCIAGAWEADEDNYAPVDETSDGFDNDCDGYNDNDLTAPLNSKQYGVCSGSYQTCSGTGGWVDDYSAVVGYEDSEVTCDTLDNDCDGDVDSGTCNWFCIPTDEDTPTEALGVNRHVWISGDYFITLSSKTVKGKTTFFKTPSAFSLEDTNGCSCSQILTQLNEYNPEMYGDMLGHWKFGCSKSVMEEFVRLVVPEPSKTFSATDSLYYDGPTNADPLYATGPISFSWNPFTGVVTGGFYDEEWPVLSGTIYHNEVTSGNIDTSYAVSLTFTRGAYIFGFSGTLSSNTLIGMLAGPYYFTATGTVTP